MYKRRGMNFDYDGHTESESLLRVNKRNPSDDSRVNKRNPSDDSVR